MEIKFIKVIFEVVENLLLFLALLLSGLLLLKLDQSWIESLVQDSGALLLVVAHLGHCLYHFGRSQAFELLEMALDLDLLVHLRELLGLHCLYHLIVSAQSTSFLC